MNPLRIASVHYLNAEPLTWGFDHGSLRGSVRLSRHAPATIPRLLSEGEADIGLIPSIEYQRTEGLELLPGLCVGSRRRARSVLLVSRGPIESARRIAVDRNSRTSVALLRIILAYRGVRDVAFNELTPSLDEMLRGNDAALIIGDPALTCDTRGARVMDLGTEWARITGLPFVFAVWAKRLDTLLPEGVGPFVAAHREGLARIDEIARRMCGPLRLSHATIVEYLTRDLHYELGTREIQGMDLFFRQAREMTLIPAHRPVRFFSGMQRNPRFSGRGNA